MKLIFVLVATIAINIFSGDLFGSEAKFEWRELPGEVRLAIIKNLDKQSLINLVKTYKHSWNLIKSSLSNSDKWQISPYAPKKTIINAKANIVKYEGDKIIYVVGAKDIYINHKNSGPEHITLHNSIKIISIKCSLRLKELIIKYFSTDCRNCIVIWDWVSKRFMLTVDTDADVESLTNFRKVIVTNKDNSIDFVDEIQGKTVYLGDPVSPKYTSVFKIPVFVSDNDKVVLTGSNGSESIVWDSEGNEKLRLPVNIVFPEKILLAPDGKFVISLAANNQHAEVWGISDAPQIMSGKKPISFMSISDDSSAILTVYKDNWIVLTDPYKKRESFKILVTKDISSCILSSDKSKVIIGSVTGWVLIYGVKENSVVCQYHISKFPILSLAMSKDDKSICLSTKSRIIVLELQ